MSEICMLLLIIVPYSPGPQANIVHYTNARGCDSLVNFYINEVQVSGTIQANPASLPCGGSATSTLSLSQPGCFLIFYHIG
ncbi:MAG: hypothetical protein IPN87_12610 [Saprospiraceae bacterium]|nr:hypothetical protein [Candidatus Brachybacter algidus]